MYFFFKYLTRPWWAMAELTVVCLRSLHKCWLLLVSPEQMDPELLTHFRGKMGPRAGRDFTMFPLLLEVRMGRAVTQDSSGSPRSQAGISRVLQDLEGIPYSDIPISPAVSPPTLWSPWLKIAQSQDRVLPCCPSLETWLERRKSQHSLGPEIDSHPDCAVWGPSVQKPRGSCPLHHH